MSVPQIRGQYDIEDLPDEILKDLFRACSHTLFNEVAAGTLARQNYNRTVVSEISRGLCMAFRSVNDFTLFYAMHRVQSRQPMANESTLVSSIHRVATRIASDRFNIDLN